MKDKEQYFNQLYTETYLLLKRYVSSKISSNESEDILQETYYQAYKNLNTLISHPNPTGWLMVTCKNIINKHIAKNKKLLENTYMGAEDSILNISTTDNYDSLYMNELKKILSDDTYFLLAKKYVEGYSIEELAHQLNITDGACKMRLKRAKKEARKKIKNIILALLFCFLKDYILIRGLK